MTILTIITMIGLPIFLFTKRILKAKIINERSRNVASFFSAFTIVPMIYAAMIIGMFGWMEHYPKLDFDSQSWESQEEERFKMSKDIIESKMLLGKTENEVIEILGNDFIKERTNSVTYYLGFVPGFLNIDPDVLDIYFENNKVTHVEQRRT